MQTVEDTSILNLKNLLLMGAFLGEGGQDISGGVSFALSIVYAKVILKKLLGLADLARTQTLCIHKLAEVIIIGKHENLILVALQIVLPSFKNFNND